MIFSGMLKLPSLLLFVPILFFGQQTTPSKRLLALEDLYSVQDVSDPQVSPDGQWVAYSVSTINREEDKRVSNIWMVSWDGRQDVQLTHGTESASSPRWSPDGKFLTFVRTRDGKDKGAQVWILNRLGGEASQLTHLKNFEITAHRWAPNSRMLLLVLKETEEQEADDDSKAKPPKPIVIDRYHFKQDEEGYLAGPHRNHIYLFDVATGKLDQLTSGPHDEMEAAWSPDGTKIAYTTSLDKDPDRTLNTDVFVVDARPGATPRKLTVYDGPDNGPLSWSPDGRLIAYLQGLGGKYSAYSLDRLAVVPAAGGEARVLTQDFDRGVQHPTFSSDGKSILVVVPDDRISYAASVSLDTPKIQPLVHDKSVVSEISITGGRTALVMEDDAHPAEIYALGDGAPRKLTSHNDGWIAAVQLRPVEEITFQSADGTEVHGLITKPAGFQAGRRYPMLLRIHGGPNDQEAHDFEFEHQLYAANGYVVLNVNYRGSSGRGYAYGAAITADWGNKEVADLLAGVDFVVKAGLADPQKLVVGGWSYGGILTDYIIASDNRFKAAISGAGSANFFGIYGIDEYTYQYDNELGPPWQNPQAWMKLSYPFFKADHIHTPTLFLGGDKDFNVPIAGGEQMYQALKTLNVPTELVIYPGEYHEFTRPSFIYDRWKRDLAWYAKYLGR
ncbi:MAG TPA: S9 family peptidase [Bryobacteraceae bacterium]|jgi:dipeptidyl aminopeptidase/acylaminoacyl peptidase|nr:S9 family peptidase [Bryobacteraceae bacterium]